jgi:hypothetical protein
MGLLHSSASPGWDASTLAHEYGHFVHHTYGFRGTRAVLEGFANTFPQRQVRYLNKIGEWSGMTYSYVLQPNAYDWRHHYALVNGEILSDDQFGTRPGLSYYPSFKCTAAEDECMVPANCPYDCAGPMVWVFWELQNNVCAMHYGPCAQGQAIVTGGTYAGEPWRLANSAFAYAASMMPVSGRVGDFMLLAQQRYSDFRNFGYLTTADLDHVVSVFGHHCTGEDLECTDPARHRLPGSPLPSDFTWKSPLFVEAEDMAMAHEGIGAGSASGGYYASSWPNTYLQMQVTIINPHTYRLRLVARGVGVGTNHSLRILVNGQLFGLWGMSTPSTTWAWRDYAPAITLPAGANTIRIENYGFTIFDLDAALVDWVP